MAELGSQPKPMTLRRSIGAEWSKAPARRTRMDESGFWKMVLDRDEAEREKHISLAPDAAPRKEPGSSRDRLSLQPSRCSLVSGRELDHRITGIRSRA